jgi:hypothetical protein
MTGLLTTVGEVVWAAEAVIGCVLLLAAAFYRRSTRRLEMEVRVVELELPTPLFRCAFILWGVTFREYVCARRLPSSVATFKIKKFHAEIDDTPRLGGQCYLPTSLSGPMFSSTLITAHSLV